MQLEIRQLAANRQRAEQQEWAAAAEQLLKHHHCHPELPVRHSGPHHPSGSPFPAAVAARPHGGAQHKRHWCEAEEGSQEPEALEPEQQRCRSMTAGQLAAAGEGRTAAVGRGSRLPWTDEELRRHIARLEREIAVLEQGGQPPTAGVAAAGQVRHQQGLLPAMWPQQEAWQREPGQPCQLQTQQACQGSPSVQTVQVPPFSSACWAASSSAGTCLLGASPAGLQGPGQQGPLSHEASS